MLLVMTMLLTVVQTRVILQHKETTQDAVLHHYPNETPMPPGRFKTRDESGSLRYPGTPWHQGRESTDAIFDPNCDPTGSDVKIFANNGRINTDASLQDNPGQASHNPAGQQNGGKSIIRKPGVIWKKHIPVNERAFKDPVIYQVVQTPSAGRKGGKGFEGKPGVTWNTKVGGRVGKHNSLRVRDGSDILAPGANFEKRRGSHDVGRASGVPWSTVDGGRFSSSTLNLDIGAEQFGFPINPMVHFIGAVAPSNRPWAGSAPPTHGRILSRIHHSHGQWSGHSHVLVHPISLHGSGRRSQTGNLPPFIVKRLLVTPEPILDELSPLPDQSRHTIPPTSAPPVSTTNRQLVPEPRHKSVDTPTASGIVTNNSRNRRLNGINPLLGSVEGVNINLVSSTSSTDKELESATATPTEMSNAMIPLSTAKPFAVRTATPFKASTAKSFAVRTATPLEVNTAEPFQVRTGTLLELGTAKPFGVRTVTPLEASTAKTFEARTATPLEASTATPFDVRTETTLEVGTTPAFEGSTVSNSEQSTGLPSTTATANAQDVDGRQFEGLVVGTSGSLAANALLHERLSSQWQSLGRRMQEIADKVNGGGTPTQQTR